MKPRAGLILALTLGLLAAPLPVAAQPAKKTPRIGVLMTGEASPPSPFVEAFRRGLRDLGYIEGASIVLAAAPTLGVTIQSLELRSVEDFDPVFARLAKTAADAVLCLSDPFTIFHRQRILDVMAKQRLPAIYESRDWVAAGGLMSYGVNLEHNFQRAAGYVDKILKGAKPADLPIEQPTKFELIINLKTAKALGLTIPPSLLLRADQVIE